MRASRVGSCVFSWRKTESLSRESTCTTSTSGGVKKTLRGAEFKRKLLSKQARYNSSTPRRISPLELAFVLKMDARSGIRRRAGRLSSRGPDAGKVQARNRPQDAGSVLLQERQCRSPAAKDHREHGHRES